MDIVVVGGGKLGEDILHGLIKEGHNLYPASIAQYDSRVVETILMIAMFTFGLNFNFFYLAYERRWKEIFKDEELKWYIYIILGALAIISLALIPYYDNFFRMIHDVLFNIVSIMSTTAYTTVDILEWPLAAHTTILSLMFVGAMSGSTASGLKVIRIGIYLRSIKQEIQHLLAPNRVIPMTYNGKRIEKNVHYGIVYYLMTYLAVFVLLLVVLSFDAQNFSSAFSATIATISNIGGSLDLLGPSQDYASLSNFSKIVMSVGMIIGCLEIYPVIILLSRSTWRKF
ncbi:TrkH family potassium uptake protein [Aerococcus viridans]